MRCSDFYKKWEKDPNWCEKTPAAVSQINSYLELRDELEQRGIDRQIIYAKFPEGAARPVINEKDPDVRIKLLNYICACLNRSEKVTAGDLKNLIPSEKREKHVEDRRDELTNVNSVTPVPEVKPALLHPSLGQRERQKEMAEAEKNQPVTDTDIKVSPVDDKPLPPLSDDAPMEERLKRDEVLLARAGFKRASDLTEAKPIIPAPYSVKPVPVTAQEAESKLTSIVRGYLTDKSRETWEFIRKTGELGDTDLEIFQAMIDRYGEVLGVA